MKEEIVRLGATDGLVSRETSYVAVEERESPETGEMTLKKIPIALTRGWGGLETSTGVMACMVAPPSPDVMMSCDHGANLISPRSRDAASRDLFDIPTFMRRSLDEAPDKDLDLALDEGAAVVREAAPASALPSRKEPHDRILDSARPLGPSARALFWLERGAAGAKDAWRLLARKARAWLDASGVLSPGGGRWKVLASAMLGSRLGV